MCLIWSPSSHIYRGWPGLFWPGIGMDSPGTTFVSKWEAATSKAKGRLCWRLVGWLGWSADRVLAPNWHGFGWELLGGPWGRLCMIPGCPRSVTCSGGPSNPCERTWLVDAICLGLRSVFSLLLRCVFYLILLAYKYLPTLGKMVNNKSLPLCWCSYFMCLCRNLWRKIDT